MPHSSTITLLDESKAAYHLLAYCARAECNGAQYQQLAQKASELNDWAKIPTQAEAHGLAPLLYLHLQAAGVELPLPVKRELQGLYLRHRRANQVRTRVLSDIISAYQAAGIQVLVLKGAALAQLIYPQPGLRPMRDLDILVKKSDAIRAQRLLAELGFHAPLPENGVLPNKHLASASLRTEGFLTSVEVHHNLFDESFPASMEIEDLTVSPLSFSLPQSNLTAYTLGYEDMLWHLCQHMTWNASVFRPTRLIWIADIVTFAEHFVHEIDWPRLQAHYPLVLNVLSLIHFMTPLSEALLNQAPIKIGQAPQGIGVHFQGWPSSSIASQKEKGYRRILHDTFFPSEWWLRLHYGVDTTRPLLWYRWVRHPFDILGWTVQLLRERLEQRLSKHPWG